METSIIIESNQQLAKKNHLIDYGTAILDDNNNQTFSNNKWRTKLPQGITLDVGDTIQYNSSMIKSKGLSDQGVELIGQANANTELVDNEAKIETGYYISNNWQNNLMLPKGLASLKDIPLPFDTKQIVTIDSTFRNFDFINTYNEYNVPYYNTSTSAYVNIPSVWYSDYGGPSLYSQDDWFKNGPESLSIEANDLTRKNTAGTSYLYNFINTNPTSTGNLCNYVPDNQRLYLGPTDWLGPYQNGWDGYHNDNFPIDVPYSRLFDIIKTEAEIKTNTGFNSPIVIGQKITESLNDPELDSNTFVKPQLIEYRNDLYEESTLTNYKNYFRTLSTTQVIDETCKTIPTSFGKRLYNINNGIDNFALNDTVKAKTGGTLADLQTRSRYMWNTVSTGDFKRTRAMSNLYKNLNLSKNAITIQTADFNTVCIFSGNINPSDVFWPTKIIENDPAYPTSAPFQLGEQIVLHQDLIGFTTDFTATTSSELKSRIIFRDFTANATGYNTGFKKPTISATPGASDKYLNLDPPTADTYKVIMTNLIGNDLNFNMLKSVINDLEKPSSNTIDIDYTNQDFLDSLYFSFEMGNLDDKFSDSIFNIINTTNNPTGTSLTNTGVFEYNLPRVDKGIPLPVCLACPSSVGSEYHPVTYTPTNSTVIRQGYLELEKVWRLPIFAGLFADENQIASHTELYGSPAVKKYITVIEEYRDNKMYEFDFFSRYNTKRNNTSGKLVFPQSENLTNFSLINEHGNYFDDSKIKELGLGCIVAYKDVGDTTFVPFIGFVCREQISSKDKYYIPYPCIGEFFGIPRSLQNNSLSYTNTWERKVKYDTDGDVLVDVKLTRYGEYNKTAHPQDLQIEFINSGAIGTAPRGRVIVDKTGTQRIVKGIEITDSGKNLIGLTYKWIAGTSNPIPNADWVGGVPPAITLTLGNWKNSYKAGPKENEQSNYPFIMVGGNDITCKFDETQSRMNFSKLHTLMKQGQQSNNLARYYDANFAFNTENPTILPDTNSGNDVFKLNMRKFYCNSTRAGFTEGVPLDEPSRQIIPIQNDFIKSKGIASSISGIGILNIYNKRKNGEWLKVNINNINTYENTLFDKLGFNMKQLLPIFGKQNNFFNRGTHNKYVNTNNQSVLLLDSAVKPLTTNTFISGTTNQSVNTNNFNFLMASLDADNILEKNVDQVSDSLIAEKLPVKFSYSHILIFSSIIPKYNYIAAQAINKIPCIGSINRSYEIGDIIYGNEAGIPYVVDKKYVLTEIDIDLKTELGEDALIDSGSTIVIRINKRKPIPLDFQDK